MRCHRADNRCPLDPQSSHQRPSSHPIVWPNDVTNHQVPLSALLNLGLHQQIIRNLYSYLVFVVAGDVVGVAVAVVVVVVVGCLTIKLQPLLLLWVAKFAIQQQLLQQQQCLSMNFS